MQNGKIQKWTGILSCLTILHVHYFSQPSGRVESGDAEIVNVLLPPATELQPNLADVRGELRHFE